MIFQIRTNTLSIFLIEESLLVIAILVKCQWNGINHDQSDISSSVTYRNDKWPQLEAIIFEYVEPTMNMKYESASFALQSTVSWCLRKSRFFMWIPRNPCNVSSWRIDLSVENISTNAVMLITILQSTQPVLGLKEGLHLFHLKLLSVLSSFGSRTWRCNPPLLVLASREMLLYKWILQGITVIYSLSRGNMSWFRPQWASQVGKHKLTTVVWLNFRKRSSVLVISKTLKTDLFTDYRLSCSVTVWQ